MNVSSLVVGNKENKVDYNLGAIPLVSFENLKPFQIAILNYMALLQNNSWSSIGMWVQIPLSKEDNSSETG